ncbi:MAG: DUF927 domain-containing protein [Lachnospiraceae bacterium]
MSKEKATITENEENKELTFVRDDTVDIKEGQYGKYVWPTIDGYKCKHFLPQGNAIKLEKVFLDIATLERTFILTFDDAKGNKVSVPVPRQEMTEANLPSILLGKGGQITKKTAPTAIATIFNQEPEAPCERMHEKLGFIEYNQKIVFLGSEGIGVSSAYQGDLEIRAKGDFGAWRTMCEQEVLGTPMEFILAVAGSAPVLDYFQLRHNTIDNILVSLVGESSTGKTTAGCLGVSAGSKCSFQGKSMITTFGDSVNSIMHSIHSSFPMLIDEGSLIGYNPTNLIYSLAGGKEKSRLTKELKKAESMTFSTTIFMTSEKSILRLCDENTGLLVRCFELEEIEWTKNAQSADRIKNVCEKHYGFLIPRIASKIVKADEEGRMEEIIKTYEKYKDSVIERAKNKGYYNPFTERVSKTLATILLGSDLVSEILGVTLNKDMILNLIEEKAGIADSRKMEIGNRAMDFLCQYISIHYTNFVRGEVGTNVKTAIPVDCKGRIQSVKDKCLKNGLKANIEVLLPEIVFDEILSNGGFPDKKVILGKWKRDGILDCYKDRYISSFIIAEPPKVRGYKIYIPVERTERPDMKKIEVYLNEIADSDVPTNKS